MRERQRRRHWCGRGYFGHCSSHDLYKKRVNTYARDWNPFMSLHSSWISLLKKNDKLNTYHHHHPVSRPLATSSPAIRLKPIPSSKRSQAH